MAWQGSAARRDSADYDCAGQQKTQQKEIVDPFATARDICYRLLAVRARTELELRNALLRKGIDEDIAEDVLAKFAKAKLIDDEAFAEAWVRSRHQASGMSRKAMLAELRTKGVDAEIAVSAAAEVDDESEEQRARELVRKKLRSAMSGSPDEVKLTRRLVGVLARKGYAPGLCYRVVREELSGAGLDAAGPDALD